MGSKENNSYYQHLNPVKPEPQDTRLPPLGVSNSPRISQNNDAMAVKKEAVDAIQAFANRDLPVPQWAQNSKGTSNIKPEGKPASIPTFASTPDDATQANPKFHVSFSGPKEIEFTPEKALENGLKMVDTIEKGISNLQLGSQLRRDVWLREVANLRNQGAPSTLIAVCGATGAGKSSILNALLDDQIVPTSGMRACTAVVTEIAFHEKRTIDADVSFLSVSEWKQELSILLDDLIDEDGNIKRCNDLKSDAGVAWSKVHAVYPSLTQEKLVTMTVDQILALDPQIAAILGKTKTIVAKDSKTFGSEIAKYIDSKDQKRGKKDKKGKKDDKDDGKTLFERVKEAAGQRKEKSKKGDADGPALWPLIRQVNVRCSAKALSTGAVLVDLPGVADANAARNNIAKDYMKKADCIWILAPITRAVDDKTARDLLGDAFKMQLLNGAYDDSTITFVATKCDDVSCTEIVQALNLDAEPEMEEMEAKLDEFSEQTSEEKKKENVAKKLVKGIEAELKDARAIAKEYDEYLDAVREGVKFSPKLTKKAHKEKTSSKKRKNARGGKKGSPKRRRSSAVDSYEDDSMSSGEESSSSDTSDFESDSDSNSDSDDESKSVSDLLKDSDADSDSVSDGGSNNGDEEEEETEASLKEKIRTAKENIKAIRERLNEARQQKKEASDSLAKLKKNIGKVQKEKNAFCSLKRSEFSRDVLRQDFRTGLKELDDAAAEEKNPDTFDPNNDLRDYDSIKLPVFTVSSRDYVRLKGQVKGDGEPTCFSNVNDTGVPELQDWCQSLTVASRERAARNFLNHLATFSKSVDSYVTGISDVSEADRAILRDKWESSNALNFEDENDYGDEDSDEDPFDAILSNGMNGLYRMPKHSPKVGLDGQPIGITPRLTTDFSTIINKAVKDLQAAFRDGLEEKCRQGAIIAADEAVPALDKFVSSIHWATFRATLRRHGCYRQDLNVELVSPFTRNIASTWSAIFEKDLFGPFEAGIHNAIKLLVQEVERTAAPGLKDRTRIQGETCLEEAKVALSRAMQEVKNTMTMEQKEVSRSISPHAQNELIPGYDLAMEERGTGSVARQKACFRKYVEEVKEDLFDGGAETILKRLSTSAENVGVVLVGFAKELAQKAEVNMAVLWEGVKDDPRQIYARAAILKTITEILEQLNFWTEAAKMRQRQLNEDVEMAEA